jgi:hypothetical protein
MLSDAGVVADHGWSKISRILIDFVPTKKALELRTSVIHKLT